MDVIRPQPAQERFLSSPADIAIYGGAAGGGKSWALTVEPLRHVHRPGFGAVLFRRVYKELTAQGGAWDASSKYYPALGATANLTDLTWTFKSGARIQFSHMQHEKDVYTWKSSELPLILFDQLESFTSKQFWYMFSRLRSTLGIRPYIRAGCNPEPGWLADFLEWWIDQDTGYPIPSRAGHVRWFVRLNDKLHWADNPAGFTPDVQAKGIPPKSVAFYPANLADNQILEKADPGYRANLMAMHKVDRDRLLGGNWKVTDTTGCLCERGWLQLTEALPVNAKWVRYWDKAGTPDAGDWSAGVLIGRDQWGYFWIADVVRGQWSSGQRNRVIKETAALDAMRWGYVETWIEQEGGSGGKESAEISIMDLAGYDVHVETVTGEKTSRFKPFAAQAEAGNVRVLIAPWTRDYIDEITAIPNGAHDDQGDATAGGFNKIALMPLPDPSGSIHVGKGTNILDSLPQGVF